MNRISAIQNEEGALQLLRARTYTYSRATLIMCLQLVLTVLLPVAGTVAAIVWPTLGAYVAAVSLVIAIADPWIIDPSYKLRLKRAAKIAEQFDCKVLDLPWDQFIVGDKVEAEDIHTAARRFAKHHNDTDLRDWYPKNVGAVELHLARIICQRSNLRYDSNLRRSYGSIIWISAALIVAVLFLSALLQNLSLADWVLRMTPATPMLAWAVRQYYAQRDTAELLEGLMKEARELWADARTRKCNQMECSHKSREFQNAIYARRATSPLVLPFLYRLKRSRLEEEMNVGAANLLGELGISSTPSAPSEARATR